MAMKSKGIVAATGIALVAAALSFGSLLAQQAPTQVAKPTAEIEIVAVTAKATDPNVLQGTLDDGKTKVQFGTTGLDNVSIGVPVTLEGVATDPKLAIGKYAWILTAPSASQAKLSAADSAVVKFTPDVSGIYKADLVLTNEAGDSPMASVQIHAGEYIGTGAGNCFQCHPQKTQEWSQTNHASMFTREVNLGDSHYSETCIRCHETGYAPGVKNGGFADVQAWTGWKFPSADEITAGKDQIWQAVPEALQNMSNIQCEACHGPAKDHVTKGASMATSLDNDVCDQCHDTSAKHIKGTEISYAKHSDEESQAFTYPVGPSRQDCVRCHSGAGYASFIKAPTEKASWDNSMQTVGCSTCHDPHSDANKWQLRITGVPVESVGITKDFGLSATCVECHNARTTAADAAKASFPHYSAAGEMLSDMGGVTYGQSVPNSPHGAIVGMAPTKNPDPNAEIEYLFGGAAPGSCVSCHMWPTPADAQNPDRFKVGEHSFNMVSPDSASDYAASCQSCHPGVTNFEFQAKADYDGNGQAESVQTEVAGALNVLKQAIADSGVKPVQGHPYFDRADTAKANDKQKNAVYNYLFVRGLEGTDGKANAIHNFKRSIALVQLSYKDLTGKVMPGATLMK